MVKSAKAYKKNAAIQGVLVQQMLKGIGIAAEIKTLNPAVMWGAYFEETQYDMVIINSGPDLISDPDYSATTHSKRPRWHFHPGTPEMDKLLEDGLRTLDREKRKAIYDRLQEVNLEESFQIALYGMVDLVGKKKGLGGYKENPNTLNAGRLIREWYWE